MVLHLLVLWGRGSQKGPAAEADIRPLLRTGPVEQEKFLFSADCGSHIPDAPVSEQLEHLESAALDRFHRTEEVGLEVQRCSVVCEEDRRYAERTALGTFDYE